jgi:hypothetical protein
VSSNLERSFEALAKETEEAVLGLLAARTLHQSLKELGSTSDSVFSSAELVPRTFGAKLLYSKLNGQAVLPQLVRAGFHSRGEAANNGKAHQTTGIIGGRLRVCNRLWSIDHCL